MINKTLLADLKEELELHIPDFMEEFSFLSLDEEKFVFVHKDTNITLAVDHSHTKRGHDIYSAPRKILTSIDKKILNGRTDL